jgi:hypothetical protein
MGTPMVHLIYIDIEGRDIVRVTSSTNVARQHEQKRDQTRQEKKSTFSYMFACLDAANTRLSFF